MAADAGSSSATTRLWRVRALIFGPAHFTPAPDGGLPEQLEFHSRLPPQAREYEGIPVAIQELPEDFAKAYETPPGIEPVYLVADLEAADVNEATEKAGPVFEAITDLMSFDMGAPLPIGQVDVSDITPPIAIGDERETSMYGAPPFSLNARSVEMQAIQGRMLGQLPDSLEVDNSKLTAALRWFVKALGTDLLHDQFIFLWIALEILCDASEIKVLAPYVGPCHHKIAACPECETPTTRMVRGATMRAFLERFGISESQAKELWAMRQLMHGAIPFDSTKLKNLGSLVQPLRAVVASRLKEWLGKGPDEPPLVAASGASIHPALGAYGTGQVTEEDLWPLISNDQDAAAG
jgi:hypothetical protein